MRGFDVNSRLASNVVLEGACWHTDLNDDGKRSTGSKDGSKVDGC
jgi:hypothetical protein